MKILSIRLIFFLLLFPFTSFSQTTDIRVEPPFWWSGMADPGLQLMVYGENLAGLNVLISDPDVKLKEIHRVENPNYLFLDLEITQHPKLSPPSEEGAEIREGQNSNLKTLESEFFNIVFEYQREIVATYTYELKQRKPGSQDRKGFDNSDVVYLIMPDRFSNGNPGNDDMPGMKEKANRGNPDGRHGGDIQGIVDHLDYIEDLGVTAIWINPLLENNMPRTSYHGYAATDFYKIDPRYGTNQDYAGLVTASHQHGIKVIMDMVFNHCGSEHWWMNDLPTQDWIHQFPEYTHSNYRIEVSLDPYATEYDKELMVSGWFDRTMPDMNQQQQYLANYLTQNSIWWIEYAGLDGIRMDTYPYSYKDFMQSWIERIRHEYSNFNVVGETWLQKASHTAYFLEDTLNRDGFNSHLPTVTDFPMLFALQQAFNEQDGWATGISRLYYILSQDFLYSDPMHTLVFFDNHDLSRYYSVVGEDPDKWKMGLSFVLTTRGIPMIYYGTEIFMTGNKDQGDAYLREDFPGGWPGDEMNAFFPEGRTSQQEDAYKVMKKLLNWRKDKEVIHSGKLKQFVPQDGIYVYSRFDDQDTVMIVMNNNSGPVDIHWKKYKECTGNYQHGKDIITDNIIDLRQPVKIPGKTAWILELE